MDNQTKKLWIRLVGFVVVYTVIWKLVSFEIAILTGMVIIRSYVDGSIKGYGRRGAYLVSSSKFPFFLRYLYS